MFETWTQSKIRVSKIEFCIKESNDYRFMDPLLRALRITNMFELNWFLQPKFSLYFEKLFAEMQTKSSWVDWVFMSFAKIKHFLANDCNSCFDVDWVYYFALFIIHFNISQFLTNFLSFFLSFLNDILLAIIKQQSEYYLYEISLQVKIQNGHFSELKILIDSISNLNASLLNVMDSLM